jgi:hypothetical protein
METQPPDAEIALLEWFLHGNMGKTLFRKHPNIQHAAVLRCMQSGMCFSMFFRCPLPESIHAPRKVPGMHTQSSNFNGLF